MFKGKFVVLSVLAALLLCWQFLPMNTNSASSGIVHPCSSEAEFCTSGSRCWFICPQGDGQTLANGSNEICIHIEDATGAPIAGILATDFWLIGCTDLCLCNGSGCIDADSATNDQGNTTMSGTMSAGGCDLVGVQVVCQGVIVGGPTPPCNPCLSIWVTSPDLDCTLIVDIVDFTIFAAAFVTAYDPCCDYNCDGIIDLIDFALFAQHWQHRC
jgi:hypothetical protein